MSVLSFSLKNAVSRSNPSSDGLFSYGKYTSSNAFTIFTDYKYTDGTALVLPIFDLTKVLAWKGASEFPHLGFENIQGNLNITPQPFPDYGIYLHPFYSSQRDDVGVRFNCPVTANLSIVSKVQKEDVTCGDGIGYRILRNGIEVQTRTLIPASYTPSQITTGVSVVQGDILDFIVDVGDNSNSFCDDVALEVTLDVVYSKLPTPSIVTTGLNCESTTIEGKGLFVPNNVTAVLCNGDEAIAYTPVSIVGGTYNSAFKFTNLDLRNFAGKQLKIRFESPLDTPSDFIFVNVGTDGNCVTYFKPIITSVDECNYSTKSYSAIKFVSNTKSIIALIDVTNKKVIGGAYVDVPYVGILPEGVDELPPPITYIYGDKDMDMNAKYRTIAFSVSQSSPTYPIIIRDFSCSEVIRTTKKITGRVDSVNSGLIVGYDVSFKQLTGLFEFGNFVKPAFIGAINNGFFTIEVDVNSFFSTNYILYAFKIEY